MNKEIKYMTNINIKLGLLTWLAIGAIVIILLMNIFTPKKEVEVVRVEESSVRVLLEEIRKLENDNRNLVTEVWRLECVIDGVDIDDCFTY